MTLTQKVQAYLEMIILAHLRNNLYEALECSSSPLKSAVNTPNIQVVREVVFKPR